MQQRGNTMCIYEYIVHMFDFLGIWFSYVSFIYLTENPLQLYLFDMFFIYFYTHMHTSTVVQLGRLQFDFLVIVCMGGSSYVYVY